MKPKRPTETDLLALVQDGFNAQLAKDREAMASDPGPLPQPGPDAPPSAAPADFEPMVRITLAIQEDLRYRLKMVLMGHRRKSRSRMTQDEYCAKAIRSQLDLDEGGPAPLNQVTQLAQFLRECLKAKALVKAWVPRATALLEGIGNRRT